jgi:hypothetical protein
MLLFTVINFILEKVAFTTFDRALALDVYYSVGSKGSMTFSIVVASICADIDP